MHSISLTLFCVSLHTPTGHVVNEPLLPSTVSRIPVPNDLFKTPILLLTQAESISETADLSLTLETLLRQPGIEPKNVIVFYNESCCAVVRHLVNLFGFMSASYAEQRLSPESRSHQIENHQRIDLLKDSLETAQLLFPDSNQLIIMEAHLILSPDFLPFFGQMIPLISDPSSGIIAVSAWNENGFMRTSSDPKLVFRSDARIHAARFAVMINRMRSFDHFDHRNSKIPSWSFDDLTSIPYPFTAGATHDDDGDNESDAPHIIFPDVSRVSLIVTSLSQEDRLKKQSPKSLFFDQYMSRPRNINMDEETRISIPLTFHNVSSYEHSLRNLISSQPKYRLEEAIAILRSVGEADRLHSNQTKWYVSLVWLHGCFHSLSLFFLSCFPFTQE